MLSKCNLPVCLIAFGTGKLKTFGISNPRLISDLYSVFLAELAINPLIFL
ncbi:hypothetical protein Cycma_1912 [Cyclobacterium marinum DSM 745]|uniref:Uncharacterized protein n=1 Tax=Cyclobacterium marinum (strain ATCC 25205 / DSM 745 / LMG 13164 / NCIMB 1802) TaxID=880070 RepID=G0IYC8_CYCMS|nr:hypothetical protein Cycma_1912 [Cyclobacterium marinum DSM 745]